MRIGYARVSTTDQNLDMQRDALGRPGCKTIYEDRASGGDGQRPQLRRKIAFASLMERIDTVSPVGRLMFHVLGALAEFERNLIRERILAGLAAARATDRSAAETGPPTGP